MRDWPYIVERPGRGQVRACPTCGCVAVFSCHHDGGSVKTVVMNAARAAWLRRTSGEYQPRLYICEGCGYEGPAEIGGSFGPGYRCARCSGRSERQVVRARRQVVPLDGVHVCPLSTETQAEAQPKPIREKAAS